MQFTNNPDLLQRAQSGDPEVISSLYECYHLAVFRYLFYRVGDSLVAEDLTSEVFLRMIRSLPRYTPGKFTFQAWLFQIAHNLAIDHYRKSKYRNHSSLEESLIAHEESIDSAVQRNLDSEKLQNALTHLTDEQREVIILRFISGMPISDVAQTLNKSENAIKGLQRRALNVLRQVLLEWEISYA